MDELFDKIFYRAIQKSTTDIHFILKEKLIIRFRILGELHFYDEIEYDIGSKLMNYLKYRASINTNYRLLPQTGQFIISQNNKDFYLRVSFLPSTDFESIVIRILNNHDPLSIEKLTHLKEVNTFLHKIPYYSSGLILISGATGSGKSTTLYTILDEIMETQKKNIVTIEDPIEMRKEECLQIELNEKLGITYQDTLKQILRHDPDVIMIGEIRDSQTAQIALTCALTGHLVLTTIHASNAHLALKRLENLGVSKIDLEDVVIGSLSQKIKYDRLKKEVIILAELMEKKDIIHYLENQVIEYHTFVDNAHLLITEKGYDKELFKEEFYE